MNGHEVYEVLKEKGIDHLFHANSVMTSCTFLRQGALVSRGYAAKHGLQQTSQYTDKKDEKYGVWHDVFLDSDDYHRRISDRNKYGPVIFVMDSRILTSLPGGSIVLATRSNPSKWTDGQKDDDRYFLTRKHMQFGFGWGTFDHEITVRTPTATLPFSQFLIEVILDNPLQKWRDGSDVFATAMHSLQLAATHGKVSAPMRARTCNPGCKCLSTYQAKWRDFHAHFEN